MPGSCCKKTFKLNPQDDIAQIIQEAFKEASKGVKGPVVVILPRNILEDEYRNENRASIPAAKISKKDFSEELKEFTNLLNASKRPLMLIGGGCIDASEEIEKFVSALQIPVVSTLMGIGIYPSENNLYLGMIGLNGVEPARST